LFEHLDHVLQITTRCGDNKGGGTTVAFSVAGRDQDLVMTLARNVLWCRSAGEYGALLGCQSRRSNQGVVAGVSAKGYVRGGGEGNLAINNQSISQTSLPTTVDFLQ
jgi:hypothetical protein